MGQNDAVEVAVRNPAAGKDAPILVLRGYPNGKFESSDEAKAPKEAVRKLGQAAQYAANVVDARHWTAEWRIPFAALGVTPSKDVKLSFNLTVRKTAGGQWMMWAGTGGYSWSVENAGFLVFAP